MLSKTDCLFHPADVLMRFRSSYHSNRIISNLFYKILIILLLSYNTAFPQQSRYFDAPLGGGGGYAPGWYMPDLSQLNKNVKAFGISEFSTNGFYTSGGAGFIYVGFIPGLRIGGMGYGGSTSESSSRGSQNKEVIYSLSGGGLTIEYSLPFIRDLGVSVGGIIGGGSLQIEIYENQGSFDWNNIWEISGPGTSNNVSATLVNNFWIFSPTLNIDIPVYRFITFRIGGGYQISLGDEWTLDNEQKLTGVPSDLNGNSFFIQSGIFIGFFSY